MALNFFELPLRRVRAALESSIRLLIPFALVLLSSVYHKSALSDSSPIHVVFVNGIRNTPEEALISMQRLRDSIDKTNTRSASEKRKFIVAQNVYNPTGWDAEEITILSSVADFLELFLLKTAEECFRADFDLISVPNNVPRPVDLAAALRIKAYLDDIVPGKGSDLQCGTNGLVRSGQVSGDAMEGTKQAVLEIVDRVKSREATIIVAHSQGNLLAHLAYAAVVAEFGDSASQRLRIVNVANTSELSANNLDLTHSDDKALGELRVLPLNIALVFDGATASRNTPECASSVCKFRLGAPTLDTASGFGDDLHHNFVNTYLSSFTVAVLDGQGVSFTPGATRFVDRLVDTVYAAAASLRPEPVGVRPSIAVDGQPRSVNAAAGATATFSVTTASGSAPLGLRHQRRPHVRHTSRHGGSRLR